MDTNWMDRLGNTIGSLAESPLELTTEMLDRVNDLIEEGLSADPFQRDPEFIASLWPLLKAVDRKSVGRERVSKGGRGTPGGCDVDGHPSLSLRERLAPPWPARLPPKRGLE